MDMEYEQQRWTALMNALEPLIKEYGVAAIISSLANLMEQLDDAHGGQMLTVKQVGKLLREAEKYIHEVLPMPIQWRRPSSN